MFNSRYEMYSQALSAKAYSDSNNLFNYEGEDDALVFQVENNSVRHSNGIALNQSFGDQVISNLKSSNSL